MRCDTHDREYIKHFETAGASMQQLVRLIAWHG
jgi:hypothetical protein